jgi:hypothetical protein
MLDNTDINPGCYYFQEYDKGCILIIIKEVK